MHVLTTHGISTITVPDDLPGLLRDFTKDVIRAQPTDLVHYAAVYFSALAGIGAVGPDAIDRPKTSADQQRAAVSGDAEAAGRRGSSAVTLEPQTIRQRLDAANSAAAADGQQEGDAAERPPDSGATDAEPATDAASGTPPPAAWGVSRGGEVLQPLPLPSPLYASRRTSDRQLPAARRSTAEVSPAQLPVGDVDEHRAHQDELGPAAADEISASAAQGAETSAPGPAHNDTEAGGSVVAVNEEDAALIALAERLFKEADENDSGGLDRKEFRNVMRSMELGLSTAQVRALMAEADENDDGVVDWREFLPAFLPLLRSAQAAQQVAEEQEADLRSRATAMLQADMPQEALEEVMRDIFRSADADGSGALSRKEFKACLSSDTAAGLKLSRQDVNTLLTEVDTDGNGTVDYEEFIPVAFNILVERLKTSLLAAEADPAG